MKNPVQSLSKKLSKSETQMLKMILSQLRSARNYLNKEQIVVGYINKFPHNKSFINKDGLGIDPVEKFSGSQLCDLDNGIEHLKAILTYEEI